MHHLFSLKSKFILIISILLFSGFLYLIYNPFANEHISSASYSLNEVTNNDLTRHETMNNFTTAEQFFSVQDRIIALEINTSDDTISGNVHALICKNNVTVYDVCLTDCEVKNHWVRIMLPESISSTIEAKDLLSLKLIKYEITDTFSPYLSKCTDTVSSLLIDGLKTNYCLIIRTFSDGSPHIYFYCLIALISIVLIFCIFCSGMNEKTFIVIALSFGMFLLILNPFPNTIEKQFDTRKVFAFSENNCSERNDESYNERGFWLPSYSLNYLSLKSNLDENISDNYSFYSNHSEFNSFLSLPVSHTVASLGLRFAKLLNLNRAYSILSGRVWVYIFCMVLCFFSIKKATWHKPVVFALCSMPCSLIMFGSLSGLPIIASSAILFLTLSLKYVYHDENHDPVSFFEAVLLLISMFVFFSGSNPAVLIFVILIFTIPSSAFNGNKQILFLLTGSLMTVCIIAWNVHLISINNTYTVPYISDAIVRLSGFISDPLGQASAFASYSANMFSNTLACLSGNPTSGCLLYLLTVVMLVLSASATGHVKKYDAICMNRPPCMSFVFMTVFVVFTYVLLSFSVADSYDLFRPDFLFITLGLFMLLARHSWCAVKDLRSEQLSCGILCLMFLSFGILIVNSVFL